jgi:hypothetical protein
MDDALAEVLEVLQEGHPSARSIVGVVMIGGLSSRGEGGSHMTGILCPRPADASDTRCQLDHMRG